MNSPRPLTPPYAHTNVYIDAVDVAKRIAHVVRAKGDVAPSFLVHFRTTGDSFQVPAVGERWMVERRGWEWRLLNRLETPGEGDYRAALAPGDNHVRATGTVHVHGTSVKLVPRGNESDALPIGIPRWEVRTTVGATTSWTLTRTPVGLHTMQLFDNGLLVDPSTLTLTADANGIIKVLGFASVATAHKLVVYYQAM